ncbi:hypothetical protein TNCT_567451 [Trichonephila clavata]|uniref:Uncharacterized protein n=1 Tax=Trichonephila clavata TaxID=2740835 RepID=A0A8X6FTB8_TRICU|nr:hypothetical protein TNCT_567451 [Trichonephila clavata]
MSRKSKRLPSHHVQSGETNFSVLLNRLIRLLWEIVISKSTTNGSRRNGSLESTRGITKHALTDSLATCARFHSCVSNLPAFTTPNESELGMTNGGLEKVTHAWSVNRRWRYSKLRVSSR